MSTQTASSGPEKPEIANTPTAGGTANVPQESATKQEPDKGRVPPTNANTPKGKSDQQVAASAPADAPSTNQTDAPKKVTTVKIKPSQSDNSKREDPQANQNNSKAGEATRGNSSLSSQDPVQTMTQLPAGVVLASKTTDSSHGNSANPCQANKICTPVSVFFGTNRKRVDKAEKIDFGASRSDRLVLGQILVTVPIASRRKLGEVPRPTALEKILGTPKEGDPAKHFTIVRGGIFIHDSVDAFVQAVARTQSADPLDHSDHAIVFVHGYNTSFEDAAYRSAQISFDLGVGDRPFGTMYLFSWPSGANPKDYIYDGESAQFSVPHLRSFIEIVAQRTGAKHVHLIAHSMGNRPLVEVLASMVNYPKRSRNFGQIILAAPDIDASQFSMIANKIGPLAKGVTLYASSNDFAMKASRQVHKGSPRAGDVPESGPVIVSGVDTIDVSAISTAVIATGHSEYATKRELLNDIALLVRKGERPPHDRSPMLKPIQVASGTYWQAKE